MTVILAVVAFIAALIVFIVRILGATVDIDWGFAFLAAGLLLMVLPGALAART